MQPVLKRLLKLGASPDPEFSIDKFRGPVLGFAVTIRALDALEVMDRLDIHRPVLKRDVVRRNDGQPQNLVSIYTTGDEAASRAVILSADGRFIFCAMGFATEGFWRSDGKAVELFEFPSD